MLMQGEVCGIGPCSIDIWRVPNVNAVLRCLSAEDRGRSGGHFALVHTAAIYFEIDTGNP